MRNWQKLSVPALIFVPMMLLMISSCQTTPSQGSPDVLAEIADEKDAVACKHFQTPLYTLDELKTLSGETKKVLGLWDQLWVDFGCA
jgi:hypothetical protein